MKNDLEKDWTESLQRQAKGIYELDLSRAKDLEIKADYLHISKEERDRLYVKAIKIRESALRLYKRRILELLS